MDRSAYDQHYLLDKEHFWRVAKRRLVLECIAHYVPPSKSRQVLDIGGACSLISQQLEQFGSVTVVEPDEDSVMLARSELGVRALVGALPHEVPVTGPFDVIVLLDVLEHVDDDLASLITIRRLLAPDGIFVLTVPAYQWLWSSHDLVLHHRRRYSRGRLRRVLGLASLNVMRISYYTGLLLPIVAAQRLGCRLRHSKTDSRYRVCIPNKRLNATLDTVMSFERWLLRRVDMPFGSSLIAVAGK